MAEYMGMAEYYAEYLPALSLSNSLISGLSVNPVMSKSTALVNQNENNNVCCNKNGGYYLEPGNNISKFSSSDISGERPFEVFLSWFTSPSRLVET